MIDAQPITSNEAGIFPPSTAGSLAREPRTMSSPLIKCPKCSATLGPGLLGRPEVTLCPMCAAPLLVEVFPALFRRPAPGREGELVVVEGESSCFYHPQKKAAAPCDVCGRFLCALCDCEVKGRHLCPGCLESGQKQKSIRGLENMRALHSRTALLLSILPLLITGPAAIWVALRYRQEPGSLVQPMRWAFPVALVLGSLQTLLLLCCILYAVLH